MPRLVTWNMQGSSHLKENKWNEGVRNLLVHVAADLICLQECGSVPASATLEDGQFSNIPGLQLYRWGTDREHVFIVFVQSDPNGNRCNLAIVSRVRPDSGLLLQPGNPPRRRPALGVFVDGAAYFSLHALSGGGPDVTGLLTVVQATVGAVGPWCAAGDYNRGPQTIHPGPWNVCPPNTNTFPTIDPESQLDYVTVGNTQAGTQGRVLALHMSDHLAVQFDLT